MLIVPIILKFYNLIVKHQIIFMEVSMYKIIEHEICGYRITNNPTDIKFDDIERLIKQTYWAKNRPIEIIEKAFNNSMNFSLFDGKDMIGYSRVITDYSTNAYICDVVIDEKYRGKGIGQILIKFTLDHPDIKGIRRVCLLTKDAQGFYNKFGFNNLEFSNRYMEIINESF